MSAQRKWDNTYSSPDNLVELFENALKNFTNNRLFGTKDAQGVYQWVTYADVGSRVDHLRAGLAQLGVGAGDAVGIISRNSTDWMVCAYATYGLNAHFMPMYEKELESVWQYIIGDASIKVLFVSKPDIQAKILSWKDDFPSLERVILIDAPADSKDSMHSVEALGETNPIAAVHPAPLDLAVVIYTSGTTGDPKGVMLSHGNCTSCSQAGFHLFSDLNETDVSFSHLPWAHVYAFSAELNNILQFGGSIGFLDSLEHMTEDLPKVRPTFLISVPRVFNMVYSKIFETMQEEGGMKLKLFNMAVKAAKSKRETGKAGFTYKMLDKLVFGKIRAMFGGRLKYALTASAKMNPDIETFFFDIGIPVYDCYGLSETSPAVTMNSPSGHKVGSVGRLVEKVDVVIDTSKVEDGSDDGEIVVYGPNVMLGYLNKPEKTAEVMTEDGGLRTGDQGHMDADGFLFVTGRFKEEYKLENGKYVFPAEIEEEIKLLPYVNNAFVYGDGKPYNVLLLVPYMPMLERFVRDFKISVPASELLSLPAVKELLLKEIGQHLKKRFGGYEIPQKMAFLQEDFSVENGMLTQTLKIKRRVVVQAYHGVIESIYE
jgi:long-chain acyl-CoA synthetase